MRMSAGTANNFFDSNISNYVEFDLRPSFGLIIGSEEKFGSNLDSLMLEDRKSLFLEVNGKDTYLAFNIFKFNENEFYLFYHLYAFLTKETFSFYELSSMEEVFEKIYELVAYNNELDVLIEKEL